MNILTKRKLKKKIFAVIYNTVDGKIAAQRIVDMFEVYVIERDNYQAKLEKELRILRRKQNGKQKKDKVKRKGWINT